jgi:FkbM family methyltransferase
VISDRSDAAPDPDGKRRQEELGRRIRRLRRRILDVSILRGSLPLRARMLPHRASHPDVQLRERAWREASPAYAAAMNDDDALPRTTRVITLDGLKWWVPLTRPDDAARVERYLGHQDFPYRTIAQTRELAVGGSMIDIGANIGRMSIPRVILGDVTAAYCAEPDPLNFTCLARNARDNHLAGLVLPDQVAIGSRNGAVRLTRSKTAGGHRVVERGARSKKKTIEVPCLTLDTWIDRMRIPLDDLVFVKVDVQGSEVEVLRGAARLLARRHVAWQVEVDDRLLQARGFRREDLFDLFRAHFTHFVDLGGNATGDRLRPIGAIAEALDYVSGGSSGRTDVLVFTLEQPPASAVAHRTE